MAQDGKVVKLKFPCGHGRWPLLAEMNEKFLSDPPWTPKQMNDWLKTRNAPLISPSKLSRHRRECLSLPKLAPSAGRRAPVIGPESYAGEPIPTPTQLKEEGLRILYGRMRKAPEKVPTQYIVPIVIEAMRAERGKPPKPGDDSMDEVLKMMAEEEAGRGDEGELHEEQGDENDGGGEAIRQAAR